MTTQALEDKTRVIAVVDGQEFTDLPHDLFIPPDALLVLLDTFSGPLDLLLYLIRKQNIDILNIPIVKITEQYLQYIQLMEFHKLELAAEYLLMAAMLAEIKSRFLLPRSSESEQEEDDDPRMTLVRRLQAYEQIKQASELLDQLPRYERDIFSVHVTPDELETFIVHPDVALDELVDAFQALMKKAQHEIHHQVTREALSVRDRMSYILNRLQENTILGLNELFEIEEGRMGLVVSLLAILELARQSLLIITQTESFAPIYIKAA